jgi:hypothetical protein
LYGSAGSGSVERYYRSKKGDIYKSSGNVYYGGSARDLQRAQFAWSSTDSTNAKTPLRAGSAFYRSRKEVRYGTSDTVRNPEILQEETLQTTNPSGDVV